MDRTPWVGGNWKSNGSINFITELAKELNQANFDRHNCDVVIFPTAIHIGIAREKLKDCYQLGCQNISKSGPGAFTGEITAGMVRDLEVRWVMVGHSERRHCFGETDEVVGQKVEMAMKEDGICIAICIGELLEERNKGATVAICRSQLEAVIPKVNDWNRVVIAYEPVWAIGTGIVATPEQAQEAHAGIRNLLSQRVGTNVAEKVRIVYGGSVTDSNCKSLIACKDVDGFLVGGASLKKVFLEIVDATVKF